MKNIIVIGIGRFGLIVARELAQSGHEVLAIDQDEERVQEVSNYVTHAVQADFTDEKSLETLGISEFDIGIVGIGRDLYDNIGATYILKEFGVSYIITKAKDNLHGEILQQIGADEVVYPERDIGLKVSSQLNNR